MLHFIRHWAISNSNWNVNSALELVKYVALMKVLNVGSSISVQSPSFLLVCFFSCMYIDCLFLIVVTIDRIFSHWPRVDIITIPAFIEISKDS